MSGTTNKVETTALSDAANAAAANMFGLTQDIVTQPYPTTPPAGFDEALYLAANPDVAEAVKSGQFKSGFDHYRLHGQVEGRPGVGFDEDRYLAANPDVAEAVRNGTIASGREHYQLYGIKENRPGTDTSITAPFTLDEEAAFESTRDIAGRAGDIYNQQAEAVAGSSLPAAIAQTQGITGALTGLAEQGATFLPGLASAATSGAEIAAQADQYTPAQQGALTNATDIASQAEQFIPAQGQALSASQGIAGQADTFLPAFGSALSASQGISGQAGQYLPIQAGATEAAQGIASQAANITPIGQRAAATGQNIANAGTGLLPTTVSGTMSLAQAFPNANIGAYMNPYTEAVLRPALEDLADRAAIQQNALNSRAGMTGSFGGSRNALAQQQFNRDLQRETGRLSAEGYARAFDTGANQFRLDQTNIPKLYENVYNQFEDVQGLQKGASDLGTAALNNLTTSQNLQRGVADIGAVGLAGLTSAQGLEKTNASIAQAGLTGLETSLGLQKGVSTIGLQGLDALGKSQGLEKGVAEIAKTGLEGLTTSQDLQKGAAELGLAGLRGVKEQQGITSAPAAMLGVTAGFEGDYLKTLAGLGAANTGLISTQVNPLLSIGGMERGQEQTERNLLDARTTAEQNDPQRKLDVLRSSLNLNTGSTKTTTTTEPKANTALQVLGTGLNVLTQAPKAIAGYNAIKGLFRQGGLVGLNR